MSRSYLERGGQEKRERIAALMLTGMNGKQIAYEMRICKATCVWHMQKIFKAVGVQDRLEYMAAMMQRDEREIPWEKIMFKRLAVIAVLALSLAGCTKTPIQRHPATATDPGSTTATDADAYDALVIADDLIQSTKKDLIANKYPAATAATITTVLRATIDFYNPADNAYRAYHADQTNTGLSNALIGQIQQLKDAVAKLVAAKKGT